MTAYSIKAGILLDSGALKYIAATINALIKILWSDLTFKQQSSWIYYSAGTPVLILSRPEYSEVALECLQSSKSGNSVA